jgi:hypothetical protein
MVRSAYLARSLDFGYVRTVVSSSLFSLAPGMERLILLGRATERSPTTYWSSTEAQIGAAKIGK